jgi:uncharacterized protein (UPF0548 family)
MKVSLEKPSALQLDQFLISGQGQLPSYAEKWDTRTNFDEKRVSPLAQKYNYDERTILLGAGKAVFTLAKQMIREWKMFPEGWTKVYPDQAPVRTGQRVAVLFKLLGWWWWNTSEIQYTIDEADRFGFAYGTLPGHVESGEELFLVEMDANGKVWYSIKAFSRPAYWIVQLVYPYARSQQRRFVKESMARMKELAQTIPHHA